MRKALLIGAMVLMSGMAFAQQPAPGAKPPPYVPITISESDHNQLRDWLLEQPAKVSLPVLQWLEGQQQNARMAKMKEAPKPDNVAAAPAPAPPAPETKPATPKK